jgi:hypothetical protein
MATLVVGVELEMVVSDKSGRTYDDAQVFIYSIIKQYNLSRAQTSAIFRSRVLNDVDAHQGVWALEDDLSIVIPKPVERIQRRIPR